MSKKFVHEQFCSNNADPITLEDFEDGQDLVIINISSSEKSQCYLRSSLCEFWKNNEIYYMLPLGGYIDHLSKVMICTSKYMCFGVIKRETKTIKGEKTKIHLLRPIDENQFLNENKKRLHNEPVPKNLNKMLVQEFTNTRLKAYLKCEDRCSMWHSVESRTPFADDINLIEWFHNLVTRTFKQKRNEVTDTLLNVLEVPDLVKLVKSYI